MVDCIQAIGPQQLNPQGDGTVTVSILDPTGIICYPNAPAPPRPAIVGDVYSIQPTGVTVVARPAGTNGPWERAVVDSGKVVYAPQGNGGPCYVMPCVSRIPNA